jgi:predicted nucleic acid-binding protein
VSAATPGGQLVLDASLLIAAMEPADAHHRQAQALMAAAGPHSMRAHWLTMAELLVGAMRCGRAEAVESAVAAAGVRPAGDGVVSAMAAAGVRAATGLKLPDAVVLATAQALGAGLATFDATLATRAEAMGLEVLGARAKPDA